MNGKIKKLKDNLGGYIFPVTSSKSVYMDDGVTVLNDKIKDHDTQLEQIAQTGTTVEAVQGKVEEMARLGLIQAYSIGGQTIGADKTTFFTEYKTKNLFNKENTINGYYMNHTNGTVAENSSFFYSKPNICKSNTTYVGMAYEGDFGGMITYFNSNGERIGGIEVTPSTSNVKFTTPVNCTSFVFSSTIQRKNYIQIEEGNSSTNFVPYIKKYVLDNDYKDEVILKKDSTMTTRKILDLAKSLASKKTPVRVQFSEGVWDMYSALTNSEKADTTHVGITIPDYVTLEGVGRKENVIFYMSLTAKNQYMSTLNMANTSHIKNCTVKGINTRYAIHDDFATETDFERKLEDVIVIGENTYFGCAYGSGGRSGENAIFDRCEFINKQGSAFLWHSNANFIKPATLTFNNCKFNGRSAKEEMVLRSVKNSNVKNKIVINNCNINGITIKEDTTGSGADMDFEIVGGGNTKELIYDFKFSGENCINFSDENINLYSPAIYSKGVPIYRENEYGMQFGTNTNIYRFLGVLMKSVVASDFMVIKTSGMVKIEDMNLSSVNVGDKIGISNGTFVVTTGNDYIGICTQTGYIKLKS